MSSFFVIQIVFPGIKHLKEKNHEFKLLQKLIDPENKTFNPGLLHLFNMLYGCKTVELS